MSAVSGPTARITGRLKGRLAVIAHQARDLQSKQMLGTMDPYVVLSVRSEKIKSQVHTDGGRTPKWEHAFCFNLDCDENEVLHVKVMNKELVTDDTIGVASVSMKDLVVYHQVRRWYQLVDKNNFSKIAGAIEMTVDYQGDGVEYVMRIAPPAAAASAPMMPLAAPAAATAAPMPVMAAPLPVAAPAPAPAPAPYYPPISPAAAPPSYYPPPAAAPPSPYGYPPQPQPQPVYTPPPQPSYAAPPQPAYAAPPQPYGAPPAGYYPPSAAPYGYAPPPQPAYYAAPPAPQVVYAAPPQPTVVYQQPRPEVVIIEERPLFW